jgi:hypothetical protein
LKRRETRILTRGRSYLTNADLIIGMSQALKENY